MLKIIRLLKAVKVVEYVNLDSFLLILSTEFRMDIRTIEDYAVVYIGSALFKITRLLIIATFTVHLFACIFFHVKVNYAASPADVTSFYTSRGIDANVSS